MDVRLFTVEEANRLLPEVKQILKELRRHRRDLRELERTKALEELSWLRPDGTVDPKAQQEVGSLTKRQKEVQHLFKEALERLNHLGGQLKDLEEGLVDFLAVRGESLVCLCWKEGEDQIRFWHTQEEGYAGRRLIDEGQGL